MTDEALRKNHVMSALALIATGSQTWLSLPEIKSGRIDGANLRDVGQTVDATEGHSLRRFAPQHVELVSKNQDFRLKPCSRPEQSGQRADQQSKKMSHRDRASPDSRLFASRMRFPVGTMAPTTVFLH